ncbi:tRNA pseudouridine(38-40) synthase TruA [Halosegnis sp.]|uniref:tRNA pseudouridine(38-40) synthase TruA n=1 Tax=Halosegnis sp. TaxID=2864959 RepID=UPI0035D41768
MVRRAFRLAYDGTAFRGFQRQPHAETVENALFAALASLDVVAEPTAPPPGYSAAGRTDAGVSAAAQTVAFDCPDWLSPAALNGSLPADVRAWASADAPSDFNAQYAAERRRYEYYLHAATAGADGGWTDRRRARAQTVLDRLSGRHDFHNLTPDETGTERDLTTACERDPPFLVCAFTASGFPREFVRRAAGLVTAVAAGDRTPGFLDRVLSTEQLDGPAGIAAADPEPLVLAAVDYGDALAFAVDEPAATSAWTVFEERRVTRRTGARVAERLRPERPEE